jgi:hypothetical protein
MPLDPNDPRITDQIPINTAIAEALIEMAPSDWEAVELQLDWRDTARGMTQRVVSPDSEEELDVVYEVAKATADLDEHRDKYDMRWHLAKYTLRRNAERNWEVHAEFLMPEVKK